MPEHKTLGKTIRKVVKIGNSIGVTLPRKFLDAHGLQLGDDLELCFNDIIRIEPLNLEKVRKAVERGDNEEGKSQT